MEEACSHRHQLPGLRSSNCGRHRGRNATTNERCLCQAQGRQTDRQTEGPTEFFEKYLVTPKREALPWIFPLYFQLHYLPEETCLQEAGSSAVERTSVKSQLCFKGEKDLSTTSLGHRSQIRKRPRERERQKERER
jgi:hypothetical protein